MKKVIVNKYIQGNRLKQNYNKKYLFYFDDFNKKLVYLYIKYHLIIIVTLYKFNIIKNLITLRHFMIQLVASFEILYKFIIQLK